MSGCPDADMMLQCAEAQRGQTNAGYKAMVSIYKELSWAPGFQSASDTYLRRAWLAHLYNENSDFTGLLLINGIKSYWI